jgi:hypothetical protein
MKPLAIAIGAALGLLLLNWAPAQRALGGVMLGPGQCAGCKGAK